MTLFVSPKIQITKRYYKLIMFILALCSLVGCAGFVGANGESVMAGQLSTQPLTTTLPSTGTPITTGSGTGQAHTDRLLGITNDLNSVSNTLSLSVSSTGAIASINFATSGASTQTYSTSQLASGSGVALQEEQGVVVVYLQGTVNASTGTGTAVIRYLYNALTTTYKSCNLNLSRNSSGVWGLVNAYTGQPVSSTKIVTWASGISTLTGICQ